MTQSEEMFRDVDRLAEVLMPILEKSGKAISHSIEEAGIEIDAFKESMIYHIIVASFIRDYWTRNPSVECQLAFSTGISRTINELIINNLGDSE